MGCRGVCSELFGAVRGAGHCLKSNCDSTKAGKQVQKYFYNLHSTARTQTTMGANVSKKLGAPPHRAAQRTAGRINSCAGGVN